VSSEMKQQQIEWRRANLLMYIYPEEVGEGTSTISISSTTL